MHYIGILVGHSIATKTGDDGTTSLMYGARVKKNNIRVESYGTVDELNAMLGLARSHSNHDFIRDLTLGIQQQTFVMCAELATLPADIPKLKKTMTQSFVDELDEHVKTIETKHTYTMDWAMPGDHPSSAALDVARTICRRAERLIITLFEQEPQSHNPLIIQYLNRLSDLLWLMARWQEKEHNVKLTSVREFLNK